MTSEWSGQHLKLDIVMRNGAVMLPGGLPMPAIREEVTGELRVPSGAFDNPEIERAMLETYTVELLPAGTRVLIGVRPENIPQPLAALAKPLQSGQAQDAWRADLRWVEVDLNEPLLWPVGGGGRQLLADCKCSIPALGREADSLNHAYTLVATAFEPARRAFTGNVFLRVYCQVEDNTYAPLDRLRKRVEAYWSDRVRFAILLDALGIQDRIERSGALQPHFFEANWRQEVARTLQPFACVLAPAHDRHRALLRAPCEQVDHAVQGGFWQKAIDTVMALGCSPAGEEVADALPELIGEAICLTQIALADYDLFDEPALLDVLSYCVAVLADVWQEGLTALIDLEKAAQDPVIANPGERCNLCAGRLSNGVYYIDGAVKDAGLWANMCPQCYFKHGKGIGWGFGQLFMKQEDGAWLMVAGFPPDDPSEQAG